MACCFSYSLLYPGSSPNVTGDRPAPKNVIGIHGSLHLDNWLIKIDITRKINPWGYFSQICHVFLAELLSGNQKRQGLEWAWVTDSRALGWCGSVVCAIQCSFFSISCSARKYAEQTETLYCHCKNVCIRAFIKPQPIDCYFPFLISENQISSYWKAFKYPSASALQTTDLWESVAVNRPHLSAAWRAFLTMDVSLTQVQTCDNADPFGATFTVVSE